MIKYYKQAFATAQGRVHSFMIAVCVVLMLVLPKLILDTRLLSIFVIILGFLAFQNTNQFFGLVESFRQQDEKEHKHSKKKK